MTANEAHFCKIWDQVSACANCIATSHLILFKANYVLIIVETFLLKKIFRLI